MKTNSLKYKETKTIIIDGKECRVIANVRLNDECKNGHQDFAITGEVYFLGDRKGNPSLGGCIHEILGEHFPHLKPFIKLHLCDYLGAPMYPQANGLYHIRKGFERLEPGQTQKSAYCDYYRVTPEDYDALRYAEDEIEFAMILIDSGIVARWKEEANSAIKLLESLTGDEFIIDSKKSQFTPPCDQEIEKFRAYKEDGYYDSEVKAARVKAERKAKIEKAKEEALQKVEKDYRNSLNELDVENKIKDKAEILGFPGGWFFDNFIYYQHSKEVKFNWKSYAAKITAEQLNQLMNSFNADEGLMGLTFKLEK